MCFKQIDQIVNFLANIATILGFLGLSGAAYFYKVKIYNQKYITLINKEETIKFFLPEEYLPANLVHTAKDYIDITYSVS